MDEEKVKVIIEKIRPQLQMDGGNVELVSVEEEWNGKSSTNGSLCWMSDESTNSKIRY